MKNAATQALQGFSGFHRTGNKQNIGTNINNVEEGMRAEDRPLLGVVTNGSVRMEAVIWFGDITQ